MQSWNVHVVFLRKMEMEIWTTVPASSLTPARSELKRSPGAPVIIYKHSTPCAINRPLSEKLQRKWTSRASKMTLFFFFLLSVFPCIVLHGALIRDILTSWSLSKAQSVPLIRWKWIPFFVLLKIIAFFSILYILPPAQNISSDVAIELLETFMEIKCYSVRKETNIQH